MYNLGIKTMDRIGDKRKAEYDIMDLIDSIMSKELSQYSSQQTKRSRNGFETKYI